jgi:hypothetical protein
VQRRGQHINAVGEKDQVGETRKRAGLTEGVNAIYGLLVLIPIVGGIIWIVLVQKAANELWESQGAVAA